MELEEKLKLIQTRVWTEQLYREYDNVLFHFRIKLSKPHIQIRENDSYWGQWDPQLRSISINRRLIQKASWDVVVEVLKHEMAHQIVHEYLAQTESHHGEWFQRACDLIAVAPWARRATGRLEQFPGREQTSTDPKEKAVMAKIKKLLALHQSDNEHESYLAMREAKRLSERYKLDSLVLEDRAKDHDYLVINHKLKIVPQHQTLIASILTGHFSVETIFSQQYDARKQESHKVLEIMGRPEDIKLAEYVYFFLWNQLPILWNTHRAYSLSKGNRKSYYIGILSGFNEQLQKDNREQGKTSSTTPHHQKQGLIKKEAQELSRYVQTRHPRIQRRSYQCTNL